MKTEDVHPQHHALQAEVVDAVETRLIAPPAPGQPPRAVSGANSMILAAVPAAARLAIDLAVSQFGGQFEAVLLTQRDAVKSVLSDNVLRFLEKTAHDFEGITPS